MQNSKTKITTKELVLTALSIALITLGAFLRITLPFVSFTLQLMFVMIIALVFGHRVGFMSTLTYTFMGLMGLPVFSKGGGIAYISSPGFGYIIGFSLAALVIGYFGNSNKIVGSKTSVLIKTFIVAIIGLFIVYLMGVTYWYFLDITILNSGMNFFDIAYKGAVIFIPKDVFLSFVACVIAPKIKIVIKS